MAKTIKKEAYSIISNADPLHFTPIKVTSEAFPASSSSYKCIPLADPYSTLLANVV